MILVGYFDVPGKTRGKVHLCEGVYMTAKPLCGARLSTKAIFQWCATWPHGLNYIECEHCKKKGLKLIDEWRKENEPKRKR